MRFTLGLLLLEQFVVGNGVVDGGGGQHSVKAPLLGGGVVFVENGLDHGLLGDGFIGFGFFGLSGLRLTLCFTLWLEVVDVKAQHVAIINGAGDGVDVQLFFKDVLGGAVGKALMAL